MRLKTRKTIVIITNQMLLFKSEENLKESLGRLTKIKKKSFKLPVL